MFRIVFLVVAVLLAILAGLNVGSPRFSLGWFALAAFAAAFLVPA